VQSLSPPLPFKTKQGTKKSSFLCAGGAAFAPPVIFLRLFDYESVSVHLVPIPMLCPWHGHDSSTEGFEIVFNPLFLWIENILKAGLS